MVVPLVSVVILNYNGIEYLKDILIECLDSVSKTTYPNLEVIFVDNGSTDGSLEFVKDSYSLNLKIVSNTKNLGFAEGFNTGIRIAKGKYVALLSNDMTVDPNWITEIVQVMEKEPQLGIAGFKRLRYGTTDMLDGIGGNLDLSGYVRQVGQNALLTVTKDFDRRISDLDYIGGAMVLRKSMLNKIGLFDEDYIVFSEDIDLCCRARAHGYSLSYIPSAIIWHVGQATFNAMDPSNYYADYMSNRSRVRFNMIHFSLPRLLFSFIADLGWFVVSDLSFKKVLFRAYVWNLKHATATIKRRMQYKPTPFHYRHPLIHFNLSRVKKLFGFGKSKH